MPVAFFTGIPAPSPVFSCLCMPVPEFSLHAPASPPEEDCCSSLVCARFIVRDSEVVLVQPLCAPGPHMWAFCQHSYPLLHVFVVGLKQEFPALPVEVSVEDTSNQIIFCSPSPNVYFCF